MDNHASGTFEVKITPQVDENIRNPALGRMLLDKQFHGDLEANSKGQMLTGGTVTTGSAGYVAIELVSGRLHGKEGSFILQHTGTMNRGTPSLSVTIVPDSGTDELFGISGKMEIVIKDGDHFYNFNYTLPS